MPTPRGESRSPPGGGTTRTPSVSTTTRSSSAKTIDPYATVHRDGWRLRVTREDGGTTIEAVLVAGGEVSTDPTPVVLCRRYTGTDAETARLINLFVAMIRYLNQGGGVREMGAAFARVYSNLGELKTVGLELFRILRGTPPTVVWREPGGEYLRVVENDFSELMTERELADALDIFF